MTLPDAAQAMLDDLSWSSVLDVGAHVGTMTQVFLDLGAKAVHALEPVPENYADLVRTFGADPRVRCHRLGVSDKYEVHTNLSVFNCWSLLPDDSTSLERSIERPGRPPFSMTVMTIDAFLHQQEFEPDFIKIDVDGYDAKALRGAREYLARRHPVVMLEVSYLPTFFGDCCECMVRGIVELGYTICMMDGSGRRFSSSRDFMRIYPWDTSFDVLLV